MTPSAQIIQLDKRYTMGKWFKVKLIFQSFDEYCKIYSACDSVFGFGYNVTRFVYFKTNGINLPRDTWAHDLGTGVFVIYIKTNNDLTKLMLML